MSVRLIGVWLLIGLLAAGATAHGGSAPQSQEGLASRGQLSVVFFPRYEAILSAEVRAKVLRVYREFGQSFVKGDTLIALDPSLYRLEVEKTEVLLKAAESVYQVTTELYQGDSVSKLEMEKAAMERAVARVNRKAALRELKSCTITAPFDGRVEKVLVNEHELVEPGKLLMKIVDDHIMWARIILPTSLFSGIVVGQKLRIKVNEIDQVVSAAVSHVSAAMDPASGTFEVYSEVRNQKQLLRSGMTGRLLPAGADG